MFYVYLIRSIPYPDKTYVGYTNDLKRRLIEHNGNAPSHAIKFKPWKIECYYAFHNQTKAQAFEKYLKSSSGRAFANNRFW